jgi:hypothetical protein
MKARGCSSSAELDKAITLQFEITPPPAPDVWHRSMLALDQLHLITPAANNRADLNRTSFSSVHYCGSLKRTANDNGIAGRLKRDEHGLCDF